jgi:hypothetical protein
LEELFTANGIEDPKGKNLGSAKAVPFASGLSFLANFAWTLYIHC